MAGYCPDLFRRGDVDGAWVPEPWASRLVAEAGGVRFLDERTLLPNGDFVTAQVIASTKFLKAHPDLVRAVYSAYPETKANSIFRDDP